MYCFGGDVGNVCYKLLQIPAGLLQVGGVNDDLHELQKEGYNVRLCDSVLGLDDVCV